MAPMSETRWPTLPNPDQPEADSESSGVFAILIEETVGGAQEMRWGIAEPGRFRGDRSQAQQAAAELALSYTPRHPMMEQSREVFQLSADAYLVRVEGATATFHFRVSVAEKVARRGPS